MDIVGGTKTAPLQTNRRADFQQDRVQLRGDTILEMSFTAEELRSSQVGGERCWGILWFKYFVLFIGVLYDYDL